MQSRLVPLSKHLQHHRQATSKALNRNDKVASVETSVSGDPGFMLLQLAALLTSPRTSIQSYRTQLQYVRTLQMRHRGSLLLLWQTTLLPPQGAASLVHIREMQERRTELLEKVENRMRASLSDGPSSARRC